MFGAVSTGDLGANQGERRCLALFSPMVSRMDQTRPAMDIARERKLLRRHNHPMVGCSFGSVFEILSK